MTTKLTKKALEFRALKKKYLFDASEVIANLIEGKLNEFMDEIELELLADAAYDLQVELERKGDSRNVDTLKPLLCSVYSLLNYKMHSGLYDHYKEQQAKAKK